MAKFDWNETKRQIVESQAWQSIFRHGYEDTPRNRILMVSGNVWLHLHPSKVQKHAVRLRFTWCMGGITFLLFLVTVVTGVYLMFYYRPTAEYAYADMKYLEFDMPFGMLMRNLHRWAAHGGVILLVLTLLLSFTGYLLPWDQLSIWAVTVGSNMGRATPLLGHEGPFHEVLGVNPIYDARAFLFGGSEIGPHTLLRFYILHCIFFPLLASLFMAVHFWRIRRDGISGPL